MILPVSHERMTARRWPIVTTVLIVVCVMSALAQLWVGGRRADEAGDEHALTGAVQYWAAHPYLVVPSASVPALGPESTELLRALSSAAPAPDEETRRAEQAVLDGRLAALRSTPRSDPMSRFGYVASEHDWLGLLTGSFLDAGPLQLVTDLWFLFMVGMSLEDRWGRVVFPLFYLAAGAFAALVHGWLAPGGTAPFAGAPAAIAACMGAFTVAFARTRVRFLWLLTFKPRTFSASAYLVIPLWAAFELVFGLLSPSVLSPSRATSHWTVMAGFVFGVLVGWGLHRSGLDRRLDDAVEVASVLGGDPRIDEARVLLRRGQGGEALAMLQGLAIEQPDSAIVHEALAEVASAVGDDVIAEAARQRAARLRASA